jgi:Putative peptidoglycan binding domain
MVYRKGEPADAPMRDEFRRDRTARDQVLSEPRAGTAGFEAFKESISLQLTARAARFAEEPPSLGARSGSAAPDTIGNRQENRQNNLEKPAFPSPLFILGLGFALGVSACAGAMYYFQGINLQSPLPSPSVLAAASTLPSPSATATASPRTTIAAAPLPAPAVVDPMATLQPSSIREAPPPLPAPTKVDPIAAHQPPPSAPALVISIAPKPSVLPPDQTKLNPPEILEVQTRLESLGMKPGSPDGVFGPLLAAAIRRYEETKGRPQIGNVDRELLERLRQETNVSVPQVPPQRSKQP